MTLCVSRALIENFSEYQIFVFFLILSLYRDAWRRRKLYTANLLSKGLTKSSSPFLEQNKLHAWRQSILISTGVLVGFFFGGGLLPPQKNHRSGIFFQSIVSYFQHHNFHRISFNIRPIWLFEHAKSITKLITYLKISIFGSLASLAHKHIQK